MRGLHISDMTMRDSHGSMTIRVDATEFNRAMNAAQEDIAEAMFKGSGEAFSYAKRITENYLRGYVGMVPQAHKVANSLDYDKRRTGREGRVVRIEGDDVELKASFGSRGPNIHGGEIGIGVHTSPDDNGRRWNIAQSLQEGISPKTFTWNSSGAAEHSRQVGRKGSKTPWFPRPPYFYGFPALDFLGVAERAFQARIKGAVEREMKKRVG